MDELEVLKATAYHEAGHAVAVALFGGRIHRMSIIPAAVGYRAGNCEHFAPAYPHPTRPLTRELRRAIKAEVAIAMAGPAVDLVRGLTPAERRVIACEDIEQACKWAGYVTRSVKGLERAVGRGAKQAELIVRSQWMAVHTLAVALLGCLELDGESVHRILAVVLPPFFVDPT